MDIEQRAHDFAITAMSIYRKERVERILDEGKYPLFSLEELENIYLNAYYQMIEKIEEEMDEE